MKLITLNQIAPYTDDFFFRELTDAKTKDAIVICNPSDSVCIAPAFLRSKKTLEEHIRYVQEHQLKKAMIVAEDINFLRQCPSLEYLYVIPALSAVDFDFSPLYDMPNIRWLQCDTVYGPEENRVSHIDYSKIRGLQRLAVTGAKGHHQVASIKDLKILYLNNGQPVSKTLEGAFHGSVLEELDICQSPICSLDGLEQAKKLRQLGLSYNRKLEDISALSNVKDTLVTLEIEACGKIRDFSVLYELRNLENLRLIGSNILPNLNFIRNMPNIKSFIFMMNTVDGNLSMCEQIPYVAIKNRKHYSHKDKEFSKQI